ncbi:hypothetical protein GLAREA_00909 [Glarea lozoyensis ATCC 20868]|uniref:Uncharacterized protein n=1 Tax=Glarea lozoyensis (strain ATCC 20868 / MF5171) TaxID=1116229 RepID=S3CXU1_GLAL2|nr:uncharacterized protein GLAREA_00909 [Glarea lozoyensis ATCC 20868]EPE29749.1 hypothetical protein GLAREA_00909 [Glarea lozoyensis ATCC 20868]
MSHADRKAGTSSSYQDRLTVLWDSHGAYLTALIPGLMAGKGGTGVRIKGHSSGSAHLGSQIRFVVPRSWYSHLPYVLHGSIIAWTRKKNGERQGALRVQGKLRQTLFGGSQLCPLRV